jgi:2-O-methyltransferase
MPAHDPTSAAPQTPAAAPGPAAQSAAGKRAPGARRRKLLLLALVLGVLGWGFAIYALLTAELPVLPGTITQEEIRRLVAKDDPVILDVGANDGGDTRAFLESFSKGRVYAFEPDPRAIRRFRAATADPRAALFEIAIGDHDGTAEFHVSDAELSPVWSMMMPEGWDQSGSLHKPKGVTDVHPWLKFERTIEVKLQRLDTWASENNVGQIDFMWVDIQGAEKDLIVGAPETLKRTRFFFTEYSEKELYEGEPSLEQIAALLPDFKLIKRWQGDALFRNKGLK